jgi:hypothetical protein
MHKAKPEYLLSMFDEVRLDFGPTLDARCREGAEGAEGIIVLGKEGASLR